MAADDYIAARERFTPIERLTEHLDRLSPQVRSLLSQIEGRQDGAATTINEIEGYERPAIEADSAAGLWFSLAARAAADAGDHVEAIRLTTAAIYADPLKVDYHVGPAKFGLPKALCVMPQLRRGRRTLGVEVCRDQTQSCARPWVSGQRTAPRAMA